MKKIFAILITLVLLGAVLVGCSSSPMEVESMPTQEVSQTIEVEPTSSTIG